MRKDLNMRKGKMIAQGAHASMKVFIDRLTSYQCDSHDDELQDGIIERLTSAERQWIENSFTKICVYVDSEQELLDVVEKARSLGLNHALIQDAGHTEFGGVPTYTCCAIGPDESERVDQVTGGLKLL